MEYNSERPQLVISEYGRNIQKMIEFACTLEDREERNRAAQQIISVMGQLHPHLRDVTEFNHKLWDHLFIISNFNLDVDSPFPKPEIEKLREKPKRLRYPDRDIKYKHYGKTIERLIEKAKEFEEGEMKDALIQNIANLMKKTYLAWNRDSVNDQVIFDHLRDLSDGKLEPKPGFTLEQTSDILAKTKRKKKTKGTLPSRQKKRQ